MPTAETKETLFTSAMLSPCGAYRYTLSRVWDFQRPLCFWIGLNPSTADARQDDPTIRRCMDFARRWKKGGIRMLNLFALRATSPTKLGQHEDPIGPENDGRLIRELTSQEARRPGTLIIACWGAHGSHRNRAEAVRDLLVAESRRVPLFCLGRNRDSSPKHPLYLKSSTVPVPYNAVDMARALIYR